MSHPIDKTLQLLGKSKNKAATRLLESALASSNESVRKIASRELVSGRGVRGLTELIGRNDQPDESILALFDKHRDKMVAALRSAVLSPDEQLNRNAFRIILSRQYFEAIPSLLAIFIEQGDDLGVASPLAGVIDTLCNQYIEALERGRQRRLLHGIILLDILRVLEPALHDFHQNDPPLIPTLFLRLFPYLPAEHRNVIKIFRNSLSPVYKAIHGILHEGDARTAWGFVQFCLDNPDPPSLALKVFSKRSDVPFWGRIFETLEEAVSPDFTDNLRRVTDFDWLSKFRIILDQLENKPQKGLVNVIRLANLSQEKKQSCLVDVLRYGKPAGRLAALELLTTFPGERINPLIWQACDDADPDVQAAALRMLRRRELPNASIKILQCADSPHALVRETVQSLLPDFCLDRFLETFNQMSEEQRSITFNLVKKIDPNLTEQIRHQLRFGEPIQQAKSLLCIEYGEMVPTFEDELCTLLMNAEKPAVRVKVATLLAAGRREFSRGTLVQAFHRDTHPDVRAAAKQSLENRPTQWEVQ